MNLEDLQDQIKAGAIDTVIACFPDMYGRLMGKRFTGEFFRDSVVKSGTHGCNYLLTLNMEMDPLDGFNLASWVKGFGDFHLVPDLSSLRSLPWQPGTAMVICDLETEEGNSVNESPRAVLRSQLDRLKADGLTCNIASELEFFLFNSTYADEIGDRYAKLKPSSDYRIDYHTFQPTRDEPIMRQIRQQMPAAGVVVESTKGEWGKGQHEANFQYGQPLTMADGHCVFKQGAKEIADQHGKSISFMPKIFAEEAGNSCHIHISIWKEDKPLFWEGAEPTPYFRHFLGGLIRYSRELSYFFAPTINAYKRYQSGSWAPTRMAWAHDNRTVGFRVVGHGRSHRIENRMPGGDANPYLAFAAMIAAGLAGVEEKIDCGEAYIGNAYVDPKLAALPHSLAESAQLLDRSTLARKVFGDAVVDYYVLTAKHEVSAFDSAVTDWERMRYFERI